MKNRENFLYSTNYVNHIRTKVNHDNFFLWKMRYRLNRSGYINASTYNSDEKGIALEAIEIMLEQPTKEKAQRGETQKVVKKFSLTRITKEEHTA